MAWILLAGNSARVHFSVGQSLRASRKVIRQGVHAAVDALQAKGVLLEGELDIPPLAHDRSGSTSPAKRSRLPSALLFMASYSEIVL